MIGQWWERASRVTQHRLSAKEPSLKMKTVIGVTTIWAETPKSLLHCAVNLLVDIYEESFFIFERLPA